MTNPSHYLKLEHLRVTDNIVHNNPLSKAKPSQIELIKISTNIVTDKLIIHSYVRVND